MDRIKEKRLAAEAFEALSAVERARIVAGKRHLVGMQSREGWTGAAPFYLFSCPACATVSLDYMHGFPESQYLTCSNPGCEARIRCVKFSVRLRMLWESFKLLYLPKYKYRAPKGARTS